MTEEKMSAVTVVFNVALSEIDSIKFINDLLRCSKNRLDEYPPIQDYYVVECCDITESLKDG